MLFLHWGPAKHGRIRGGIPDRLAFREDFGMRCDNPRPFSSIVPATCKLPKDGAHALVALQAKSKATHPSTHPDLVFADAAEHRQHVSNAEKMPDRLTHVFQFQDAARGLGRNI